MDAFISTGILFFLVLNPLGNLPLFIAELDGLTSERYRHVVIRESLIALGVLLLFLLCGGQILHALRISKASLELSGGVILFLIALKLIFSSAAKGISSAGGSNREPLVVPLAIPLFAGPAAMSTAILIGGKNGYHSILSGGGALLAAWAVCLLILLSGRKLGECPVETRNGKAVFDLNHALYYEITVPAEGR